jgi:hypothetical protein
VVIAVLDRVVESKVVIEGGVGRERVPAAVLGVDAVMAVADDIVADVEDGVIHRAVIADSGKDAHVRLVDGVVVDVNVICRVPHLNGDGAFVVDQIVIDSGLGIAAIVSLETVWDADPFSSEVEKISTARLFLTSIRECAQILPEAIGVAVGKERLNCNVSLLPNGNGGCQQTAPLRRQRHDTAATVCRIHRDLEQTPALQWLEGGCQCRPVHSE